MTKMTQRDFFNEVIALAEGNGRADLVTFAQGRIEALDKKSATRKPSKAQIENEGIKATILKTLEGVDGITVTDLIKSNADLADFSGQKVSALLRQLIGEGKVVKNVVKGKALFALA